METSDLQFKVTKIQAAQRQLDTAITLYFNCGDVVSIHTLSTAAYAILRDLNKHHGGKPMLKDRLWQVLDTPEARSYRDYINKAENFFKHADRDPHGAAEELNPEWTYALVADASQKYDQLVGQWSAPMFLFLIWYMKNHPNVYKENPNAAILAANLQGSATIERSPRLLQD